jgi:predicted GIY-YIG superfamily endonuclease
MTASGTDSAVPAALRGRIYLIHLAEPIHHARHYLGFTDLDPSERFQRHLDGKGARLLRAANERGIEYEIVRLWNQATRNDERWLKRMKYGPKLCPICSPKEAQTWGAVLPSWKEIGRCCE